MNLELVLVLLVLVLITLVWSKQTKEGFQSYSPLPPKQLKLAIAVMMRKPTDIPLWFEHHRKLGISRFYARVEDTPGIIPYLKTQSDVYYEEGESDKENNYTNQIGRQTAFVNKMMPKAKEEGIDWVFHIDADELLEGDPAATLGKLPASIKIGKLKNVEAVYGEDEPTCFSAQKFIRCDKGGPCKAYVNGKGVGRVEDGVVLGGAHDFIYTKQSNEETTAQIEFEDLHVLHYDSCNLGTWLEKFVHMSKKAKLEDIVFSYYHKSIEAALKAKEVYKENKMIENMDSNWTYERK